MHSFIVVRVRPLTSILRERRDGNEKGRRPRMTHAHVLRRGQTPPRETPKIPTFAQHEFS